MRGLCGRSDRAARSSGVFLHPSVGPRFGCSRDEQLRQTERRAIATVPTQPALFRNVTWESAAPAGQILIVPSWLPEAAKVPSGPNVTACTNPLWPWYAASSEPDVKSHRRTLLSSLHVTSRVQSGENATPHKAAMAGQQLDLHSGHAIPEPDGLIPAAGRNSAAIGAKCHRVNEVDMSAQSRDDRPARFSYVVNVGHIPACQGDLVAVGCQSYCVHSAWAAGEGCSQRTARCRVAGVERNRRSLRC